MFFFFLYNLRKKYLLVNNTTFLMSQIICFKHTFNEQKRTSFLSVFCIVDFNLFAERRKYLCFQ